MSYTGFVAVLVSNKLHPPNDLYLKVTSPQKL